ncbi:hypothetical protein GP486_003549 [Trichoglossum hirsutum]|uniref:non-specific serine/threonine protein kinase n=1 Tax=Trichoglossum hirsutum TaxID=265104 RepID=A0A9P8RQJ3_9PEZI|nr:hypothetical protein GP486_003549 [Trichoglossum hirsutum]
MATDRAPRSPGPHTSVIQSASSGSTPVRFSRSSLERGGGSSTHACVDEYVKSELQGTLSYDIPGLTSTLLAPKSHLCQTLLAHLVEKVLLKTTVNLEDWKVTAGVSDREFVPWLLPWLCARLEDARELALREIQDLSFRTALIDISKDDGDTSETAEVLNRWCKRLGNRLWQRSEGRMKDGHSKREVDLALWMGPTTTRWDRTLVIGEHKSATRDWKNACVQLAGYMAEFYSHQPFRQFSHGFVICPIRDEGKTKIIVRQWIFDRSGGLGSEEYDVSTDDPDSRRRFIEFSLIYALMDLEQLGYDPQVFSDAACTIPFDPFLAPLDQRAPAFIKVQDITFQLIQVIFMREGLVCRGTVCFKAQELTDGRETGNGALAIVKMSWRLEGMVPEGKLLEEIGHVPGVVRLRVHDTGPDINQGIRKGCSGGCMIDILVKKETLQDVGSRARAIQEENDSEPAAVNRSRNRVFTRTVMADIGCPVKEAESALQLVKAVHDAFQGHWTLYHSHKILHRDISATNILMPDNSLSPNQSLNGGFLIDLDYAVRRNPVSGQFMSSGAHHRTGTLPYMAIDILTDPAFPHLYDHDVESFLYVLIWCGIYPTGKDEDPLVAWRKGKFHQIGLTKRDHMEDDKVWKQITTSLRRGLNNDAIRDMLCEIRDVLFFKPVAGLKEFRTPKQLLKVAIDLGEAHQKELFLRVFVAITDLAGHVFGSFKERGGKHMWLRDSLPKDLRGTRVLTYGYNSDLVGSKMFQGIEAIASGFTAYLGRVRQVSDLFVDTLTGHGTLGLSETETEYIKALNALDYEVFRKNKVEDPAAGTFEWFREEHVFRTVDSILRSLVKQLLITTPRLFRHIPENSSNSTRSNDTLWRIFESLICDPVLSKIYCVIDALDECEETAQEISRSQLLQRIMKLFPTTSQRQSKIPVFKFVITSRPITDITNMLETFPCFDLRANRDDLKIFVNSRVSSLPKRFSSELKAKAREVLLERVERTFLWVSIVIKKIERISLPLVDALKERLKKVQLIWTNYMGDKGEQKLVAWVVYGRQPLTLGELEAALATQMDSRNKRSTENYRTDLTEEVLKNATGIILEITDGKVHLIHQSARDFLLEKRQLERSPSDMKRGEPLSRSAGNGHEVVVQLLLERYGVHPDSRDRMGWTALSWAAQNGHIKVVNRLLTAKADVNAAAGAGGGRTALQAAAGGGHLEVVNRLLAANVDVNAAAAGNKGRIALQAAAEGGHLDVVDRLLDADADVNAADVYNSETALHAAAERPPRDRRQATRGECGRQCNEEV